MNSFTQRKHLLNMENRFDFSLAPSSPPNLDRTFLLESTEDETNDNELLQMDANNNSPKVVSANLPLPTIRFVFLFISLLSKAHLDFSKDSNI